MVTKLKKSDTAAKTSSKAVGKAASKAAPKASTQTTPDLSGSIKDSAQQIWQAGLGAFMKAQAGGTKAFEALVKEGVSLQRKTQSAAEEKITEATHKMSSMATDITSKASGQWDKLESIVEDRVAKALNKLGVPSAKDIDALIARIDALNASVQKLSAAKTAAKPLAKAAPAAAVAATDAITDIAAKPAKSVKKAPAKAAQEAAPAAAKPAARKTTARKAAPASENKTTEENPV